MPSYDDDDEYEYEEPDYDYEDDSYVIGHYHSRPRDWTVDMNDPTLLGLEIETLFPEDEDMDAIALHATNYGKLPVIPEEDGSLDDEGVEFIFKPISFKDLVDNCYIHECVSRLSAKNVLGHDAGTGYGLHISINAKPMANLHVGRFCMFFHNNKTFVEKIARRRDHYFYRYNNHLTVDGFEEETDKYLAATRRSKNRVEVRVFRSTLSWPTIQASCQFVHSVRIFSENCGVDALRSANYLEWLSTQSGYDVLNNYLSKRGVANVSSSR